MNRFVLAVAALAAALASACATEPVKPPAPPAAPVAPPPPADPAPITEGDVTVAQISGMTVIVKRLPGAELVATELYIRGGARNWGKDDAGIEQLAFSVATQGGTASLDKEAFGRRLATLGGELNGFSDRDAAIISAKGPTSAFDALFGMLTDTFLHPALPAAQLELSRQQQLLGIKRTEEDPDGRLSILTNATFMKGMPYENLSQGTQESVAKLTADQIAAHLAKLRETSRLLLVVVGDVDPAHVIEAGRAAFANLPRGNWSGAPQPRPGFAAPALVTEQRALPTNYIEGMFVAPGPMDADYAAARVATSALSERLFEAVRTKRNLSYAPGSRYDVAIDSSLAGIYVTAVDPNTTLKVMFDELHRIQDSPIGDVELAGVKAQFRTNFLMRAETTDGQAGLLASGVLDTGDWRFSKKLIEQANAVTPAQVQAYAKKYMSKMQLVLLGDPSKLDPKLATSL